MRFRETTTSLKATRTRQNQSSGDPSPVHGIYFHIPFCATKCHYCDFLSGPAFLPQRQKLVRAFLDEIKWRVKGWAPQTLFFGGGTPSLLNLEEWQAIGQALQEQLDFSKLQEWTIEMNPASAQADTIKYLKSIGVNRISLGVQSMNNQVLEKMGRLHRRHDVENTLKTLKTLGFENVNVDLIAAYPGTPQQALMESIDELADYDLAHISLYETTIEPGTQLSQDVKAKQVQTFGEDQLQERLTKARQRLQAAGYQRYEISNFSKQNRPCLHNQHTWQRKNQIGLGLGAWGLYGGQRRRISPRVEDYMKAIKDQDEEQLFSEIEILDESHQLFEDLMLALRTEKGLPWVKILRSPAPEKEAWLKEIEEACQQNLMFVEGEHLKCSEKGWDVLDGFLERCAQHLKTPLLINQT